MYASMPATMNGGSTARATHTSATSAASASHFDTPAPKPHASVLTFKWRRRYARSMAHGVSSHPSAATVTIRDVHGADELHACQELQRRAWGITEEGYVLPVAIMAGAQKVGGLILGAFDANEQLVGFAFGFLGRLKANLILYSQLTGVHPAHQSAGVGRLLKFE